jgi:hypothetical protein
MRHRQTSSSPPQNSNASHHILKMVPVNARAYLPSKKRREGVAVGGGKGVNRKKEGNTVNKEILNLLERVSTAQGAKALNMARSVIFAMLKGLGSYSAVWSRSCSGEGSYVNEPSQLELLARALGSSLPSSIPLQAELARALSQGQDMTSRTAVMGVLRVEMRTR